MIPDNLKYTKDHEWVKVQGDEALIGITDHAQEALGEIVYVGLPEMGAKVAQFSEMASVESTKAASDIFAPVSGEIIEINEKLNDSPDLINKEPYDGGWIARVRLSNSGEVSKLLDKKAYEKVCAEEAH